MIIFEIKYTILDVFPLTTREAPHSEHHVCNDRIHLKYAEIRELHLISR